MLCIFFVNKYFLLFMSMSEKLNKLYNNQLHTIAYIAANRF